MRLVISPVMSLFAEISLGRSRSKGSVIVTFSHCVLIWHEGYAPRCNFSKAEKGRGALQGDIFF